MGKKSKATRSGYSRWKADQQYAHSFQFEKRNKQSFSEEEKACLLTIDKIRNSSEKVEIPYVLAHYKDYIGKKDGSVKHKLLHECLNSLL